ncbi:MAG: alpha/beta hydrolase [Deltaproteobacteria bacterium]|nr:alpha/beta hydrolase [Deltaproteobacteria bacterium]
MTHVAASGAEAAQPWRHEEVVACGVRLHVVQAGRGKPVLLLHGFPEFWFSWRLQIAALAGAGLHVVAPDMRGYNTSEKPRGIAEYEISKLVADVVALIDHLGVDEASVVAHDWGGIVAWYLAMWHPERVERLAILNAPHPGAYRRDLFTTDQWRRSWYVAYFQLPWLPEASLRAGNFAFLERVFTGDVRACEAFAHDEVLHYKMAFKHPGALTSAINYYRAAIRRAARGTPEDLRPIVCPTLVLWGERDRYLSPTLANGLETYVHDLRVERFPEAGHWLQLDEPARVTALLTEFLCQSPGSA